MTETTEAQSTPIEDRIVTEHREAHERMLALYQGIAAELPEWTFSIEEEKGAYWWGSSYRYHLKDDAGRDIGLSFARGYTHAGKIHVSGSWPQTADGSWTSPHDVRAESPSINVAFARGYQAMAKDISRRFIPAYVRVWNAITEKIAANNAYQDRKAANWKRLVDAKLVLDPRQTHDGDPRGEVRIGTKGENGWNYDKGYGDVRMTGEDSVQLELRSLPVETAMRILRATDAQNYTVIDTDDLNELISAARGVIENWSSGDLAGAVNRLETATDYAEARITGKEGK